MYRRNSSNVLVLRSRTPTRESDVIPKQLQVMPTPMIELHCRDVPTRAAVVQQVLRRTVVVEKGEGYENKVVVEEEDLDKVFGGEWEKFEATAVSGLCTTTSSRRRWWSTLTTTASRCSS